MATLTARAAGLLLIFSSITSVTSRAVRASPDLLVHSDQSFSITERHSAVFARDNAVCAGFEGFAQCSNVPSAGFCCPIGTSCLQLSNFSSSAIDVLCCPAGQDCSAITPITCDPRAQNATLVPQSQYHSTVPSTLLTCGDSCCPNGYDCKGGACVVQGAATAPSATISLNASSTSATVVTLMTPTISAKSSAVPGSSNTATGAVQSVTAAPVPASPGFSGSAFAAGFVPGIILGAAAAICVVFLLLRRRANSQVSEKASLGPSQRGRHRDTLTDLQPDHTSTTSHSSPATFHGRTISEPKIDLEHQPSRTDFFFATPPSATRRDMSAHTSPSTSNLDRGVDAGTTPSRSPFAVDPSTPVPTQSPLPGHLKRGTLSFSSLPTISPIRGLRHQKSVSSLRRHVTNATRASTYTARTASTRRGGGASLRGSTETIQILLTPDQRPQYVAAEEGKHRSRATWISENEAVTPIEDDEEAGAMPAATATHPPVSPSTPPPPRESRDMHSPPAAVLAPPYSPSMYTTVGHLSTATIPPPLPLHIHRTQQQQQQPLDEESSSPPRLDRTRSNRDTTFSTMMERAGVLTRPALAPMVPDLPPNAAAMKGKDSRR